MIKKQIDAFLREHASSSCKHGVIIVDRSNNSVFLYLKIY